MCVSSVYLDGHVTPERRWREELTADTISIGKLLLATKDIVHFLLLHIFLLEIVPFQRSFVGADAAFKTVHTRGESCARFRFGNGERITAIGTD